MKLKSTLAAIVGATVLMGSSIASAADTTIKVWCWDDHFNVPAARMAAERFEAKHPGVKVKVESLAQNDIIQKLNASLGANNVRALPDVVLIEDYRVQNFLVGYPDFLKPINDKIDTKSTFVDYKVSASSAKGKSYGIPFDSGVVATYYRLDLFEKAGYTAEDMQDLTWDKFIEMGKKVKETSGTPLFSFDPNDLGIIRVMMQSAGQWYTNGDGTKVTVKNNAALKEALRIIKEMNDAGLISFYNGWNQMLETFQSGRTATVIQGCWVTPSVEAATELKGKWRIAPLPKFSNIKGATHFSNLGGSQWYVNNYSKNADVAVDYLKETFASDTDLLNQLVTKISLVNSLKDTTAISNYNVESEFFGGQKIYSIFADWNKQIPAISYGPHTYAVESITTEALQRVLNGEDIDAVLEDSQINAEMQLGL